MATGQGLDYILVTAIHRAIEETYRITGYRITVEQAVQVLRSQAKGIKEAMENKDIAKIDVLGKFLIKPGREELIHASKEAAKNNLSIEDRRILFKAISAEIKRKRENNIE